MTKTSTPRTGKEGGAVSPVLIVAGVAVVAFVIALLVFRGGSKSSNVATGGQTGTTAVAGGAGCAAGQPDSTYSATMTSDPNPPRAEGTTFHLSIRHNGTAVTGAKVCMTADMTEMHHEGINVVAQETSGGKYDATLKFGMRGPYAASIIITESAKPAVSVPITFQVN